MFDIHCTLDMINIDSLSHVFGRIKFNKKGSGNTLKSYRDFEVNFSSTALVIDTFYVKNCSILTQY